LGDGLIDRNFAWLMGRSLAQMNAQQTLVEFRPHLLWIKVGIQIKDPSIVGLRAFLMHHAKPLSPLAAVPNDGQFAIIQRYFQSALIYAREFDFQDISVSFLVEIDGWGNVFHRGRAALGRQATICSGELCAIHEFSFPWY
jgi:hypothetical protein